MHPYQKSAALTVPTRPHFYLFVQLTPPTLSQGRHAAIPDDLIWYHHEPTWQNIADGRLNHGLMDFSLTVSYEDDFGINLGLTASAQRAGMELGGKFEDHQNTVWQVVGRFGPSTP